MTPCRASLSSVAQTTDGEAGLMLTTVLTWLGVSLGLVVLVLMAASDTLVDAVPRDGRRWRPARAPRTLPAAGERLSPAV